MSEGVALREAGGRRRLEQVTTTHIRPCDQSSLTDGFKAERVIGEWIDFYNTVRPHSALDGKTPAEAYRAGPPLGLAHLA